MGKPARLPDHILCRPTSAQLGVDRSTSLFAELVYYSASSSGCDNLVYHRVFANWLTLHLEQQLVELKQFLVQQQEPNRLLESWAEERWYEKLVPYGARVPDKLLFISDFEIILALASYDLRADLVRATD